MDSPWLTEKVLEVLPVCPQGLQMEAITFLPEIAQEDDYEVCRDRSPNLGFFG